MLYFSSARAGLIAAASYFVLSALLVSTSQAERCPYANNSANSESGGPEIQGPSCDDQGCPLCPEIMVISINGINADTDSDFHDWVRRNTPGGIYNYHDPYGGGAEFCNSNPSAAADNLRETIAAIKRDNPCIKIIVVGHSLGGTAAWFLQDAADCSVYIDPPTDCYPGGPLVCASQTDICDSVDEGIEKDPGYIPTDVHTPFGEPERNCADLRAIRDAIDQCVEQTRPNCPRNDDTLDPPPECPAEDCSGDNKKVFARPGTPPSSAQCGPAH